MEPTTSKFTSVQYTRRTRAATIVQYHGPLVGRVCSSLQAVARSRSIRHTRAGLMFEHPGHKTCEVLGEDTFLDKLSKLRKRCYFVIVNRPCSVETLHDTKNGTWLRNRLRRSSRSAWRSASTYRINGGFVEALPEHAGGRRYRTLARKNV